MSLLDDNDNGIENTLIDPFNITVSNEAYPFPIEEFIPVTVPDVVEEQQVVVPTLTPEGAEKFHQELKTELVPESEAEAITDTPEDPAVIPSPEGEVRVSLEEEEDLNEVSKEETEDMCLLESLVEVRDRLAEIGGISKDDVYQVESIVPGLITEKIALNRISSIPTRMGLDVSLESVGAKIIETVKKILAAIVDRLKRIFAWIAKKAEDKVANTTGGDAAAHWKDVLALAAKVDSQKGTSAFKEKFGETEAGRKSGSTSQFIRLHAMSLFNKRVANFTLMQMKIQKGSMLHSVGHMTNELRRSTMFTTEAIKKLKAGKSVGAPDDLEFESKYLSQDSFREHMAKVKAENVTPANPVTKLFENAVDVKDGGSIAREAMAKYGKIMGDLSLELSRVQDDIYNKNDDVLNSVKHINIMIQSITNVFTETSFYVMCYGNYFSNCVRTCLDCKQVLRQIGGLHAVAD